MELSSYIKSLKSLKPSEELLIKSGFTNIPIDIIKNYVLDSRKKITNNNIETDNLIFELFNKYNPKYLRFADFSFYEDIKKVEKGFAFAGSSDSELIFESPDVEVIEYDREEWSVLNYCAKDTESFLEALLPLFEMYSLRIQKLINRKDDQANEKYLERCVQHAGGQKYRRFYKDIIG